MSPLDFLEFRDYIGPASGFQSVQNREIEILLGLEDTESKKKKKIFFLILFLI